MSQGFTTRNAAVSRPRKKPALACGTLVLSALLLVLLACEAPIQTGPAIEFTQIPAANPGGPLTTGIIAGRIQHGRSELKLVLYARSGRWYVQPFADHPFTTIQPDSTWHSSTHLGTEYAALLVEPGYAPIAATDSLPLPGNGVSAVEITKGTPPFWQRWWFHLLLVIVTALTIFAFYRWRIQHLAHQLNLRFEERLAERTRIAQELHDTLLQGFLSVSMQLHVVNDRLPQDSPARGELTGVLNLLGRVIEEGRNAVRGLRPADLGPHSLEEAFSHLQQEMATSRPMDFRLVVEGAPRTLHPIIRDEIYRIGREALSNVFRHSAASVVEIELEYAAHELRLLVRDNGCGIDPQVLRAGRAGHFGLSGMHERAGRIGGKLKVWSRESGGTEVELSVPGHIAFRAEWPRRRWEWLPRIRSRKFAAAFKTRESENTR